MTYDNEKPTFSISYRETHPEEDNVSHFHSSHELIFVTEGKAEFIIENQRCVLSENSLLIVSNFERHHRTAASYPYKRYVLLFNDDGNTIPDSNLLSLFLQRNRDFKRIVSFSPQYVEKIKHIFSEMITENETADRFTLTLLRAKFHELLIIIYRSCPSNFDNISDNTYRKIIYDAQNYIYNHFQEQITLQSLSEEFFTNIYYFSAKFKEYTGIPFKKYLINLRLTNAKQQLLTTSKPVAQIAKDCGFSDLANFLRTFKKNELITPLQFRKKMSVLKYHDTH